MKPQSTTIYCYLLCNTGDLLDQAVRMGIFYVIADHDVHRADRLAIIGACSGNHGF